MDRSCLIVLMSLRLAIPGELLSSIARFRFASQNHLWKQITCSSMKKQRTATVPLFACLTSRVHCNPFSVSALGTDPLGMPKRQLIRQEFPEA